MFVQRQPDNQVWRDGFIGAELNRGGVLQGRGDERGAVTTCHQGWKATQAVER
ncbi:MAG: hypothetical protein IT307_05395 [Chloroflexi bacterium]|nr:hypothetical protein [Chloroflexota bacterium]